MLFFKSEPHFVWRAQKSGPQGYPVNIINATLFFKGEERGYLVPTGPADGKWGRGHANHPEVDHTLPDRLEITFYSYAENQTYHGVFPLPYDELVRQFQWGVDHPLKRLKFQLMQFSTLIVGVAPGGTVGVWIGGPGEQREVLLGKAEPIEMDLMSVFQIPFRSKEEAETFRVEVLQETVGEEQFNHIQSEGVPFDIWQRYRTPYRWIIEGAPGIEIRKLTFSHINGVSKSEQYDYAGIQYETIPDFMNFYSSINAYLYEAYLDDYETIAAFEELEAASEGLEPDERLIHVEITPRLPREKSTIRLYNAKKSIDLQKAKFKPSR